jgi:hypothetical protein
VAAARVRGLRLQGMGENGVGTEWCRDMLAAMLEALCDAIDRNYLEMIDAGECELVAALFREVKGEAE